MFELDIFDTLNLMIAQSMFLFELTIYQLMKNLSIPIHFLNGANQLKVFKIQFHCYATSPITCVSMCSSYASQEQ